MKTILKLFKIAVGILLLPFCAGAVLTLWQVVRQSDSAQAVWLPILLGTAVWVLIYIFLPKPKLIYVFGHELTHALWNFLFGGKMGKMKIRAEGGEVMTSKSNFLISLAPYFFPFYTALVVVVFAVGNFFWNFADYAFLFYFLLGLTYAFHLTFTGYILKIKQTDIKKESYVFSAVIIFLGNMAVLLIGLPLLASKTSVSHALSLWLDSSVQIYYSVAEFLR